MSCAACQERLIWLIGCQEPYLELSFQRNHPKYFESTPISLETLSTSNPDPSLPSCSPLPHLPPAGSQVRKLVMSEIISPPLGTPGLRLTQTQKDLVGGSIGGIAQVLVGQPFDIVKVRIQTSPSGTYASPLECAKQLLKADGPRGFYKVSPHLCD